MSCNIRIINGKEVGFTDAGTESQLFKDAVNKLGEKEGKKAFLVSLSDEFKDTIPPKIKEEQHTKNVAVEKYDISELNKIASGSDRTVYDLGVNRVLKIANTARGLEQNRQEEGKGNLLPTVYETGLDYVVVEKAQPLDENAKEQVSKMIEELDQFPQADFDNKSPKLVEALNKYGLQDLLKYDIMFGDLLKEDNWGLKNGKIIHVDGGTFGGMSLIRKYARRKNESFEDFQEVQAKIQAVKTPIVGNKLFSAPLKEATDIANDYMLEKGLPAEPIKPILKLDEENSKKIATAFEEMQPSPDSPETQAAYKAMVDETLSQYDKILKEGYKVEINNQEPYSSSQDMITDLRNNKSMKIFSTESGFGDEPITEEMRKENPLLQETKYKDINGVPLLANDIFRFVHDFFGHAKLGNGFGAIGEENAWNVHSRMYSPLARRAMTTETRGQNSWVNFSGVNAEAFKKRDKARTLRKEGKTEEAKKLVEEAYEEMSFAEQKIGLLPEWISETPEEYKVKEPLSPSNSSNYANLTEDGKGNFVFYHKGEKGYETIRRSTGGTARATSKGEGTALSKVGGLAMYYTKPKDTETQVPYQATYMVKVPMEKVYDFNTDPLNLIEEAKKRHSQEHPIAAFDINSQVAYVTKIAGERGYGMVVSEWNGRTRAQTTKEYTPVDTQELEGAIIRKPFKQDYRTNEEKGFIASIPKSKEDSLDDIYKAIHNERNRQNKYDSLYHLAHSPKPSQEEITAMIMNSDISEELKQKYQDILAAPVQKRESFKVEEPALEDVMKYITSQNETKEPMNAEQMQDYKNALLSTKDFSLDKLKKAFYDENGVFFVSPSKLVASGMYSQYEAEHLQKDLELQEKVKANLEALKNTEGITPSEQDFDLTEKENEFTSFGKLNNLNPYIVQKQIQRELAATTRDEFDEAVGTLPFSNFQQSIESEEAKDKLFNDMQAFKKAEMMIEVDGEIKGSLNSNTEVIVAQVAQDLEGTKVLNDIKYFLKQDVSLLKNVLKNEAKTMLNSIEKGLIEQGYDVIGLSAKAPDVYMMQYLSAVADLSEQSSKETLDEYVNVYNEFFGKDLSPEKGFVKTTQDDRNFSKLDTNLTEENCYNQQNLIKQEEGLYIKVNPKTSEELYPIVVTYPERLPNGIKNEEQLRKYIQSTLNNDEISDSETGEVINLFKLYYGIPLTTEVSKVNIDEFTKKQTQFDGNVKYLTKDFIGDFYRKGLKEKASESKVYRDFYSNFEVTNKGLELINNDPITLDKIQPYVDEDLANYSLLSRSMPNLSTKEVEFVDSKNLRRDLISNYPNSLTKFEGNISILDDNNLIAKNENKEFIKLKNKVYENIETIGGLTLYTRLNSSKGNYNSFDIEVPATEYNLNDYLHLENEPTKFIKTKNYLSKEEKEGLEEDEFRCI